VYAALAVAVALFLVLPALLLAHDLAAARAERRRRDRRRGLVALDGRRPRRD